MWICAPVQQLVFTNQELRGKQASLFALIICHAEIKLNNLAEGENLCIDIDLIIIFYLCLLLYY